MEPRRVLAVVVVLVVCVASAGASNYYVSPSGSDAAAGTQANPFKTINKAVQAATTPGDTVLVAAGVYDEEVTTQFGGTSAAYLTLKATGRAVTKAFIIRHPYIQVEGFYCTNYTRQFLSHITIQRNGIEILKSCFFVEFTTKLQAPTPV